MNPRALILSILIIAVANANAQFPAAAIPDSLSKGARVVIRLKEMTYEIKSPGKATEHERAVYTIMNETGSSFGGYVTSYDKFTSLGNVSGTLYDANGKEVKHIKKKDMADHSGSDDETLMTDERYKEYDFGYGIYPYTVDFEEDDDIDGILELHDWLPQPASGIAVQESRYVVITPADYVLRYRPFNGAPDPVITQQSGKKVYTWSIKNMPAKTNEPAAPAWRRITPYVMVSPSLFEAEGYKGDMSTWQSYGMFYYTLAQGRDVLPADIKTKVHELTDRLTNPYDKIYALYDFMQKNTRYISIQLGIGGQQPFDATFVATKHYGDCKALSNYMVALLKEAGIKGNQVIIFGGENFVPVVEDFPNDQFNHIVACVPMQKDTVWLECTSQTESPGFMGTFTGNRKAVLVSDDGGHLVSTPLYTEKENRQVRVVNATITPEGNLDANVTTNYGGITEELPHQLIYYVNNEQRDRYLNNVLNLATYKVEKSNYSEKKGKMPSVNEELHIVSPSYASITGKRLFLAPNLFNKSGERYSADSARKYNIEFRFGYTFADSINIKIPEGYTTEALPKPVSITGKFGKYDFTIKVDGVNVYCIRNFEKKAGQFSPADYAELVKFYDDIYKADRSRVVFVKKDS